MNLRSPRVAIDIAGPAIPRLTRRRILSFVSSCLDELRRAGAVTNIAAALSIAFVSDREMTALNARFRGKRRTTDVLTFEATTDDAEGETTRPLGEIVISVDQARRQAAAEHHSLATEIRYLLLHGLIHALGYDHESDDGEMNSLEWTIRERVGL